MGGSVLVRTTISAYEEDARLHILPGQRYFLPSLEVLVFNALSEVVRGGWVRILNLRALELQLHVSDIARLTALITIVRSCFFWLSAVAGTSKAISGVLSFAFLGMGYVAIGFSSCLAALVVSAALIGLGESIATGLRNARKNELRGILRVNGHSEIYEKSLMRSLSTCNRAMKVINSLFVGGLGHRFGMASVAYAVASLSVVASLFSLTLDSDLGRHADGSRMLAIEESPQPEASLDIGSVLSNRPALSCALSSEADDELTRLSHNAVPVICNDSATDAVDHETSWMGHELTHPSAEPVLSKCTIPCFFLYVIAASITASLVLALVASPALENVRASECIRSQYRASGTNGTRDEGNTMMVFYIRHAQDWSNVVHGSAKRNSYCAKFGIDFSDAPLTAKGERQAKGSAKKLVKVVQPICTPDIMLVSTFLRTMQTGRFVAAALRARFPKLPVVATDLLRENYHYRRQNKKTLQANFSDVVSDWSQIVDRDPGLDPAVRTDWGTKDGKPHESEQDIRDRQLKLFKWIFQSYRCVVLVGHSKYYGLLLGRTASEWKDDAGEMVNSKALNATIDQVDAALDITKLENAEVRMFALRPQHCGREDANGTEESDDT